MFLQATEGVIGEFVNVAAVVLAFYFAVHKVIGVFTLQAKGILGIDEAVDGVKGIAVAAAFGIGEGGGVAVLVILQFGDAAKGVCDFDGKAASVVFIRGGMTQGIELLG